MKWVIGAIVSVVLLGSVAAIADEVVTNQFARVGQLTTGANTSDSGIGIVGNAGPLVKVVCPSDSYVGAGKSDAGNACATMADGGQPCDIVYFSKQERFYVKMNSGQNQVSAKMLDAGVETCTTFEARN